MLEGSIWTPEGFRGISDTYRSTGGVTGTPRGKIWDIWAIGGRLTSPQVAGAPPTREEAELDFGRGATPLSFSYSLSFPFPPSGRRKKGWGQILLGLES